jgi:hypothetical protein
MEFRKSTSVAAVLLSQFMYVGPAHSVEADEVLLLAEDVGRWLSSTTIERGNIAVWPDDALAPEKIGYDLASGASGKVVYFIALYRATGNPEYLKCAMQGADFLISTLDDPGQFDGDQRRASLYARCKRWRRNRWPMRSWLARNTPSRFSIRCARIARSMRWQTFSSGATPRRPGFRKYSGRAPGSSPGHWGDPKSRCLP